MRQTEIMERRKGSRTRVRVTAVEGELVTRRSDWLATEEPLEIRVAHADTLEPILTHVTMRTPGNDFELAAGFLLAEGYISRAAQVREMEFCVGPLGASDQLYNIVSVNLTDVDALERPEAQYRRAVSACGVCGKASIAELAMRGVKKLSAHHVVAQDVIGQLPVRLRERQTLFESTGGLHGAALFSVDGDLLAVREDVGRHNAVDKLLGWQMLSGRGAPAQILMVSGRLSYELAQKAIVGGVSILAGVSAPSSLAVELAREFDLTLIGFLRGDAFNIYVGQHRINLTGVASR
jgi:FdhD protein